jgi:endogenous inhibitor of DNA gyrase (YacG/DUF329 family)
MKKATEQIEYNGVFYYRYPNSKDRSARKYFRPTPYQSIKHGLKRLHIQVYEDNFGKIPEGFDVHHRDGDTANNDISNLELIDKKEHAKFHARNRSEEFQNKLTKLRVEGRAKNRIKVTIVCKECGKSGERHLRADNTNPEFCSVKCQLAAWRHAHGIGLLTDKVCPECKKPFQTKHSNKVFCSRFCKEVSYGFRKRPCPK